MRERESEAGGERGAWGAERGSLREEKGEPGRGVKGAWDSREGEPKRG